MCYIGDIAPKRESYFTLRLHFKGCLLFKG